MTCKMVSKHICSKEAEIAIMGQQIKNIDEKTDRIEKKLDKFIECADSKYANKLTERIVYGLVGLILIAVIGTIIKLVIIK